MDVHFNSYKIRYEMLNRFIKPIRDSQPIKSVNIFINLDDIFHTLHRPLVDREFQACGKNASRQLVSNVFNIIGHYRNWCLKERLYPRVYAYYSSATVRFRNNMHIPEYRKHYFEINNPMNGNFYFINNAIQASYPIYHVLAKYIEDVYVINSSHIEPSIIPLFLISEVIKHDPMTTWNIVVSRDVYDLQYCYRDRWSVISPKGDNSLLITRKNMWDYICQRERVYKEPTDLHWCYDLFVVAKAVVGERYRNIPRIKSIGWKTLFNYMDQVQGDDRVPELITLQQEKLAELLTAKNVDVEALNKNISVIDIDSQVNSLLEADKGMLSSQLEDMIDYPTLSQINTELFREYPLNLAFLCNRPIAGPVWR